MFICESKGSLSWAASGKYIVRFESISKVLLDESLYLYAFKAVSRSYLSVVNLFIYLFACLISIIIGYFGRCHWRICEPGGGG